MSSLYNRIEEIQEMVKILTSDVEYLRPRLGERSIQVALSDSEESNRRFYIRPKLSGFKAEPHFITQNILLKQQF